MSSAPPPTEFSTIPPSIERGIIVGTSKAQEWLLPWWWLHYGLHNNKYPVTFVDFGDLSDKARTWCRERGNLIKLDFSDSFMARKKEVDPEKAKDWESMHPDVWENRFNWYKKPFSLLLSPYKRTLWIDLDCQICGSLEPLFDLSLCDSGFAISAENENHQKVNLIHRRMEPGQITYNAGVILYDYKSIIVEEWVKQSINLNKLYCSDQQLLVNVLYTLKLPFTVLSPLYNWTMDQPRNPDAVILHWWGGSNKTILATDMQFMYFRMFINLSLEKPTTLPLTSTIFKF